MITVVSLNPAVDRIIKVNKLLPGELHRSTDTIITPGGKGTNVAKILKQLGSDVCVVGFSGGRKGKWLYYNLKRNGIKIKTVELDSEIRENTNIIETGDLLKETELLEPGPVISPEDTKRLERKFIKSLKNSSLAVISGSLPAGAPEDFYGRLINVAKKMGVKTVLDTSGEALCKAIDQGPLAIKPNIRELSQLTGKKADSLMDKVSSCRELINKGVELVFLSMGGEGALAVSRDYSLHATFSDQVNVRDGTSVNYNGFKVINTIGSGDAMVAGISHELSKTTKITKENVRRALIKGMACALSNAYLLEIGVISEEIVPKLENKVMIYSL